MVDRVAEASDALDRGDLSAAEELGRAAVRDHDSLPARLLLAQALAWQGRGREADDVLAAVDPATLTEAELLSWALPRAANQFWMLDEPERATAFLQATRGRVSSAPAVTVDALLGTFAMNAGNLSRAMDMAGAVLASPDADQQAVGWAAAAAALCTARTGAFSDVDDLAARALAAGHPGLLRFTSGLGQTTTLILAGDLHRAHALAEELMADAVVGQPSHAIGQLLMADVLVWRGDLDAAVALLQIAAKALAPTGYSWAPLAWMSLASALGQAGRVADAGRALARAEGRHGLKSMLFAPELGMAKAWTAAARRDGPGAIAAAREAFRAAERGGQCAVALQAALVAVRLGDLRAADALDRLETSCAVGTFTRAYARALTAGDADGLTRAAESFAALGMSGIASDAARQAQAARR